MDMRATAECIIAIVFGHCTAQGNDHDGKDKSVLWTVLGYYSKYERYYNETKLFSMWN